MADQVQIQIGAEVKGLERGLAKAQRQLDKFKLSNKALEATFKAGALSSDQYYNAIAKNTARLDKAGANVRRYRRELQSLGTGAVQGGKGIKQMGGMVRGTTPALTSFSQVIQDAPYGIRGVANNIQQLTAQMGYLRQNAKAAGVSMRSALLGALVGPAGILLAVSVVTSALVAFGSSMGGATSKAKKLEKKLEDLNKSFGIELGYNKELEKSLKLQGKSTTDILNERRKILNAQIDSISVLITERQELLKIQKEANEIVSTWGLVAGTSANAWGQYKDWWLSNFNKFKKDVKLDEYREWWERNFKAGANLVGINTEVDPATAKELEKQKKLEDALLELQKQKLKLSNNKLELDKKLTEELGLQFNLLDSLNRKAQELINKAPIKIPVFFEFVDKGGKPKDDFLSGFGVEAGGLNSDTVGIYTNREQNYRDHLVRMEGYYKLSEQQINQAVAASARGLTNEEALFRDHQVKMKEILSDSWLPALQDLSGAIGTALAEGGNIIGAIGQSLLKSFGSFISKMGAQMILYGKLAVAKGKLDIAIAAGGPVAIVAGAAAIKTGILLAAAGAAIGALASAGFGGSSSSGSSGGYSGNNYGTSYGSSSFSGEGKVIFEIAGDKLYGVLNNYTNNNGRTGDYAGLITSD